MPRAATAPANTVSISSVTGMAAVCTDVVGQVQPCTSPKHNFCHQSAAETAADDAELHNNTSEQHKAMPRAHQLLRLQL